MRHLPKLLAIQALAFVETAVHSEYSCLMLKKSDPGVREFTDGDLVFMEGDDSREMYVVLEGEVVVTKKSGSGEVALATLHRGEFVGEMSLLESLPRSATARAKGATKLLAIQPGGFLLKIRRDPTFAFEMLQSLSRRIRMTNDSLIRELGRVGSTPESLRAIIQGSEYQNHELSEAETNVLSENAGSGQ
jgi:CRP/FNR family transcriptional regulator, cyclic AMP receptor protein